MADRSLVFMIPGDLEALTGGYGYDRRIIGGLRHLGWQVAVEALDGSFPQPTPFAREDARRRFASLGDGSLLVVDGLAFGALAREADSERRRLRLVALVHHPLAEETGLDPATAEQLEQSERRALASTRLVIVTSAATAAALGRYDVPAERIAVVEPGTDRASLARGSSDGLVRLLCVAALIPRKGHDVLIEALARLRDKPWRLTCVGSVDRDQPTAARVRAMLAQYDLVDRVTFTGDLHQPELDREYDAADVFVLPTFHEGYGMVVSEALARGLPVISSPTGAIADLVTADAGRLVPPGHIDELGRALSEVIDRSDIRARFSAGARRVRDRLPTWDHSARRMSEALERAGRS
jgi:glycosyltransferase involved in cell wall biosynthesis